ncbi:importin subunit alpha-1/8 [Nematocida minor]|uniref:importin subunit alpha-1/8 n=1 Tax=Nematocida minor TaxID=1912983 RepID=UPI00221F982A|nr:importin subunit alpha-1/8 [Nematocida minor]KAI5189469.1 importin subunit alpha-1/8 [Nematocida minor]
MEHMNHGYKNSGRGARSERETRASNAIELRTQKRDGMLQKKRSMASAGEEATIKISILAEQINSSDPQQIVQGVTEFRRLLSAAKCPPIDKIVMNGLTPIFTKLLSPTNPLFSEMPEETAIKIMHESCWVITNIASGNTAQTMSVVRSGALGSLVKLLHLENQVLQDQAVWAISNIAGDCEEARNAAIEAGATEPIIYLIEKEMNRDELNIPLLRNLAWAFSNLNRGRSPPPYIDHTERCLPVLLKLVNIDDIEIMSDAYWALSYMCDAGRMQADMILATGVVDDCVQKLAAYHMTAMQGDTMQLHLKEQILSPIIRTLGNIATYEESQTAYLINLNIIPILKGLFTLPYENKKATKIKKEICWVISNITAGSPAQVNEVVKNGFLEILVSTIKTADMQVRVEACWAICNATIQVIDTKSHAKEIGEAGAIVAFSKFLPSIMNDSKLVTVILDAINSLLEWAEADSVGGENIIATEIENCDLLENIEELQSATSYSVASRAEQIIRKYFEGQ